MPSHNLLDQQSSPLVLVVFPPPALSLLQLLQTPASLCTAPALKGPQLLLEGSLLLNFRELAVLYLETRVDGFLDLLHLSELLPCLQDVLFREGQRLPQRVFDRLAPCASTVCNICLARCILCVCCRAHFLRLRPGLLRRRRCGRGCAAHGGAAAPAGATADKRIRQGRRRLAAVSASGRGRGLRRTHLAAAAAAGAAAD
mmetsp:Transcript_5695/g.15763  ORF Transcript_5695/g.15763 Transcript_5695/m.15763 type:complete len:200 (-) Transcript_5695:134-733(-)